MSDLQNPLLTLPYEPAFESLGNDYYDVVTAAEFPQQILRFRNNRVLTQLGLDPEQVTDEDFVAAFGQFEQRQPLLAMCYHGYQFGEYNPNLGDGRGFLYGQVRGLDGELYDFGTKGSGRTPYSRTADGRLTLKGGVREVLAAEMLQVLGVKTSRCLSLIETGEQLWRGDEPSPTRSSVMVRFSRSHIRFGTFERLHYLGRKDLIQTLLDHVLQIYYPHLLGQPDAYLQFYRELVQRVADLTAQWMTVGFCHAVLNTDNMSITGESFDYGPYAFINQFDPQFTAAYFDYGGRYCYANQPAACLWNLQKLQAPLKAVLDPLEMEQALSQFDVDYQTVYRQRMLCKLGLELTPELGDELADELLKRTLQFLWESKIGYHEFFKALRQQFAPSWRESVELDWAAFGSEQSLSEPAQARFDQWRELYQQILLSLPASEIAPLAQRLRQHNPLTVIIRPEIEAVWAEITEKDDWQPFYDLLERVWTAVE
jgi:serine/tyrosine/threonine adenylyltransferase